MSTGYHWLAEHYDSLISIDRTPLDAVRRHILDPVLPEVTSACELACGTGTTAISLASQCIRMFAVDLSPEMCRVAAAKARRAKVLLTVLRADMRTFRLPEKVDLVTCEGDAINHLPGKADLARVAKAVARALKPGGYFFFDLNNRLGFKEYWGATMYREWRGVVVVLRGTLDLPNDHAWIDVDWFVRRGACWKRGHERVDEICWRPAEIRAALRSAGFASIRAWDSAPFFRSVVKPGCRTVYLARKP